MDDILFGIKRAHLAGNCWALGRLREFGVTPARFDLMRMIYDRNYRWAQMELRKALGVSRATISEMVRALVKLGWITREKNPWDKRTWDCLLTYEGRRVVASVMEALVWPKVIKKIIDAALQGDADQERKGAQWLALRIVMAFASRLTWAVVTFD